MKTMQNLSTDQKGIAMIGFTIALALYATYAISNRDANPLNFPRHVSELSAQREYEHGLEKAAKRFADKDGNGKLSLAELGAFYEVAGMHLEFDPQLMHIPGMEESESQSLQVPRLSPKQLEAVVAAYESRR